MSGSDLIALVPWLVFAAVLAAVYLRLRKSRHTSRHEPSRPGQARSPRPGQPQLPQRPARDDSPEAGPGPAGDGTGRDQHGARR
jgi:hypothetical protein